MFEVELIALKNHTQKGKENKVKPISLDLTFQCRFLMLLNQYDFKTLLPNASFVSITFKT
jgi:hypothetical protein